MTGEALPGRPGTLTEEQLVKLKELWIATLDVFGIVEKDEVNGEAEPALAVARTDTKKSKKKKLGMFRSGKNEDKAAKEVEQEDKYNQNKIFQDTLANLTPETLRATFWSMVKHDHPDALLLRFLRARKWDVEKALVMMISTMRWRLNDFDVDGDIMKSGELAAFEDENSADGAKAKVGADFLAQMRLGKSFMHGTDKDGRPMCFVRVRLHKQGEQSEQSLERYTVYFIESCRMVLAPPVDTACVVFDMTGFSLANMDFAPVKFMIQCFEANYPESLGVVLIHKAPWVFQGIWKIIKGWLDPVVASKVHFTNDSKAMEQFIPASQIIKELNGAEDWSYSYVNPVPGENDKMKDTATRDRLLEARQVIVKQYESAVLAWIHGTSTVEDSKIKRNQIANQLREDYWQLDPYVRARSHYDRVGLIQPGGKLSFYLEQKIETVEATQDPITTQAPATTYDDID
ncbi:CRAL-TRIO domain-containing protein [Calycina marina]|uniref:CRAL-TRIO domain-containing protein n=1 Tax=Calycina marina TaxID=1763456 RepID=A0A9P7Z246_9HELO|nr:CRAL-TRIO domain-containing protein [Calycina marina]